MRVLLADDSADIRFLLRVSLEAEGFEIVAEASDGEQALDRTREYAPDVVILDLAMPVLDGLEAIPHLKKVAPDCKIVVFSAFDSSRMRERVLQAGADAYIEKGDPLENLPRTLNRVIARGKE